MENADTNGEAILAMVCQIPAGRVATYGGIAKLAGVPKNARQVGTVLRGLPAKSKVPWFRVVNSQGAISARNLPDVELSQQAQLAREGVEFDSRGRVLLEKFLWPKPRESDAVKPVQPA